MAKKKSSNSSKKSGTEGNTKQSPTKQISPAKYWCFTLNNYTEEHCSSIKEVLEYEGINEYVIGKEVGEKGTPHLQGFVAFKNKLRPLHIFGIKEIHWEKCKAGRKANLEYCSKAEDIFATNMKIPEKIKLINKEDFKEWQNDIYNIITSEPKDRDIYWYYGNQGCGKTSFQRFCVVNNGAIMLDGKSTDMKHGVLDYYNKNGITPKIIFVNLPFDTDMDGLNYNKFEVIKDMLFHSSKYEGGMVCGNPPHLLIFANKKPETKNVKFIIKHIK